MMRALAFLSVVASAWALVPAAQAQESSLGVAVGLVDPQDLKSTLWLTANLRWKLAKNVVVEPEGGYWKASERTPGVSSSVRDVSGGVNILYLVPQGDVTWSAGAGVGLHMIRSAYDIEGFVSETDTEVKPALHFLAGAEYRLSDGLRLFGAVRYDTVSDVQQNKVYGGLRLGL